MNIKLKSSFENVTFHLEINEDILTLWAEEDELEPTAIKVIPENRFEITHDEGQIERIIEYSGNSGFRHTVNLKKTTEEPS